MEVGQGGVLFGDFTQSLELISQVRLVCDSVWLVIAIVFSCDFGMWLLCLCTSPVHNLLCCLVRHFLDFDSTICCVLDCWRRALYL